MCRCRRPLMSCQFVVTEEPQILFQIYFNLPDCCVTGMLLTDSATSCPSLDELCKPQGALAHTFDHYQCPPRSHCSGVIVLLNLSLISYLNPIEISESFFFFFPLLYHIRLHLFVFTYIDFPQWLPLLFRPTFP